MTYEDFKKSLNTFSSRTVFADTALTSIAKHPMELWSCSVCISRCTTRICVTWNMDMHSKRYVSSGRTRGLTICILIAVEYTYQIEIISIFPLLMMKNSSSSVNCLNLS